MISKGDLQSETLKPDVMRALSIHIFSLGIYHLFILGVELHDGLLPDPLSRLPGAVSSAFSQPVCLHRFERNGNVLE